jgi:hypothetical protein
MKRQSCASLSCNFIIDALVSNFTLLNLALETGKSSLNYMFSAINKQYIKTEHRKILNILINNQTSRAFTHSCITGCGTNLKIIPATFFKIYFVKYNTFSSGFSFFYLTSGSKWN